MNLESKLINIPNNAAKRDYLYFELYHHDIIWPLDE